MDAVLDFLRAGFPGNPDACLPDIEKRNGTDLHTLVLYKGEEHIHDVAYSATMFVVLVFWVYCIVSHIEMDLGGRRRDKKRGIWYVRFLYGRNPALSPLPSDWEMVPSGSPGILDRCSILLPLVLYDLGRVREEAKRVQ